MRKKRILFLLLLLLGVSILWAGRLQRERTGTAENLVVPEKINGYPVTNIYGGAFQNNNYIKKVTIKSKITILYGRMFAHLSLIHI